jgi:cell division protein FtsW (lipid II flippase)
LRAHEVNAGALLVMALCCALLCFSYFGYYTKWRLPCFVLLVGLVWPVTAYAPIDIAGQSGYYQLSSSALLFVPTMIAGLTLALVGCIIVARRSLIGTSRENLSLVVPSLVIVVYASLVILYAPDLGDTLRLIVACAIVAFAAGIRLKTMALTWAWGIAGLSMVAFTEPYRLDILLDFLSPTRHSLTTGYQLTEQQAAIASAGWRGVGLGRSHNITYAPFPFGNSYFAILTSDLGIIGGIAYIALVSFLIYECWRHSIRFKDRLWSVLAGAWIFTGLLLSVGSNVGLMPATAVGLPFMDNSLSDCLVTGGLLGLAIGERLAARRLDPTRPLAAQPSKAG